MNPSEAGGPEAAGTSCESPVSNPVHAGLEYERVPSVIYARSFAAIRREADLERFDPTMRGVVARLIHACGDPAIVDSIVLSAGVAERVRGALASGASILCDSTMVAAGIIERRLPAGNAVLTTLNDTRVPGLAAEIGNTRSAAAVRLWHDRIESAVVAIGNAPTALFHLLELLDQGWPRPAAILAFPVGFVGAVESKAELASNPRGCAFLTLAGRRGGSAMAAAAVNAHLDGTE